jgi:hypothetical protein
MWYYKARIYSPTLGRFPQVDPIGYEDQVNIMTITNGNTSRQDETGGRQGQFFVANGRRGRITTKDVKGIAILQPDGGATNREKGYDTYGHEGGHYMGVDDRSGTGLMAPGTSDKVKGSDAMQILQPNSPNNARKTIIKCATDDRC